MTDNNVANAQGSITDKTKSSMIILWILSFFFWFVPAIIYFFTSKDDAELHEEVRKVL